jgi:hypothetical protein
LRQIDSLANQLSGLSQSIMNDSSVPKNNYRDARNASQYYTGVAFEYIDLKDFVNKLPSYTSNSSVLYYASQIDQSMEKGNIIINNTSIGSSVINSHGLSIYIPYYSYDDYYDNTNFAQELLWDEMLHYLGY